METVPPLLLEKKAREKIRTYNDREGIGQETIKTINWVASHFYIFFINTECGTMSVCILTAPFFFSTGLFFGSQRNLL